LTVNIFRIFALLSIQMLCTMYAGLVDYRLALIGFNNSSFYTKQTVCVYIV